MNSSDKASQRIVKFTPLAEIYAKIDALAQVEARDARLDAALGRALAADASAPRALPQQPVALRDGWAVRADAVLDAAAFAQDRFDWGIAIESVARLYGLGFLPLTPEQYDFLLVEKRRARPAVQAFLAALHDPATGAAIRALGMRPAGD